MLEFWANGFSARDPPFFSRHDTNVPSAAARIALHLGEVGPRCSKPHLCADSPALETIQGAAAYSGRIWLTALEIEFLTLQNAIVQLLIAI